MEALDNPSYFSLCQAEADTPLPPATPTPPPQSSSGRAFSFLQRYRRGHVAMGVSASTAAAGRPKALASSSTSSSCDHAAPESTAEDKASAPSSKASTPTAVTVPSMPAPSPPQGSAPARPRELNLSLAGRRRAAGSSLPTPPVSPISPASPPPPQLGTPTNSTGRRSFRSLLRSRSATQAVMQGEPRPSDVPPGGEADLLAGDMVHCPVQLEDGGARYYNLTVPLSGRRRHSIGTFLSRDREARNRALAFQAAAKLTADEVPGNSSKQQHRSTSATGSSRDHCRSSHSRRRCPKCVAGSPRSTEMEDIVIVSSKESQAAQLWVNYLKYCFEEMGKIHNKPPYKVLCVGVEDVAGTVPPSLALEEKMVRVKLQVVIVCSKLLDHVYNNPGPSTTLGRLLQPERVVALLLGVEEISITEQHRAALISYQQWRRMIIKDQDEAFVRDFLDTAMGILSRASRQQRKQTEKPQFSLHPKKVKEGQNKVLVLLHEPLQKEDKVNIHVDKNGERLQITTVTRKNPYAVCFHLPETCLEVSMLVTVYVEKNSKPLGGHLLKCESKMRQLDQILRSSDNPMEFMCQTLGFSPGDREHLDNFLVSAFQRNVPSNFNILQGGTIYHQSHASPEEYPTLLHFAAKFGLEKLAWQLLECPGGEQACIVRNVCDLTPAELAEIGGHGKLAQTLRGYMQMTEFTNMYSYLKIMSEGNMKSGGNGDMDYLRPRPLSETYQVPPSARHLMEQNYQVPPTARPFKQSNSNESPPLLISNDLQHDSDITGYMEMHPTGSPNQSVSPLVKHNLHFFSATKNCNRSPSPTITEKTSSQHLDQMSSCEDKLSIGSSMKKSQDHLNQGIQDELVEIINDFKNNVFTISEVEKLVEAWKNRNDVQQSFREKQLQLTQMREEYERIQQQMKEQMRRPTPFDRIKKFFKGKSKEAKDSVSDAPTCTENQTATGETIPICQRPASSLSLHSLSSSSTSSGRMSTVSGCSGTSMGDSGTHSDTEERKHICDFSRLNGKTGLQNYEIPPAPRPFQGKWSPIHLPTCIEDRPPQPVPRPEVDTNFPGSDEYDSYISPGLQVPPNKTDPPLILKSPINKRRGNLKGITVEMEYLELEAHENNVNNTTVPSTPISPGPDYMNVHVGVDNFPEYMNVELSNKTIPAPPVPPRGKLNGVMM